MRYKHVFGPEKYSMWQVTVLRHPVRSGCNFPSPEEAACNCQFFKNYLYSEYKLSFEESLDAEQHAALAYRQNVDLSDSLSVFKALPQSAKQFVLSFKDELEAHRDAQPEETVFSKIGRHAPSMTNPAVREWVSACESAARDQRDFQELNLKHLFSLVDASSSRLTDSLPALRLAVKMLANATNPRLVAWRAHIAALIVHFEQNLEYVADLTANLRAESEQVFSAVANLEAARPTLS